MNLGAYLETINFQQLAQRLLPRAGIILADNCPGGENKGREYVASTIHGGRGDSFKFNLETGKWADFATGDKGGDIISFYAANTLCTQPEAARYLESKYLGIQAIEYPVVQPIKQKSNIIKPPKNAQFKPPMKSGHDLKGHWIYTDAIGDVLFHICRYDYIDANGDRKKTYTPFTFSSNGRWEAKAWSSPRPLYKLHEIVNNQDKKIIITEGEKAADAAQKIVGDKYICTCWPNGASAVKHSDFTVLEGRQVILWPDSDTAGFKAMNEVVQKIQPIVKTLKLINTNLPDGHDAANVSHYTLKDFTSWALPLIKEFECGFNIPEVPPIPNDNEINSNPPPPELPPEYYSSLITDANKDVFINSDLLSMFANNKNTTIEDVIKNAKRFYRSDGKKEVPQYIEMALMLRTLNVFKEYDSGSYVYDKNYWRRISDTELSNYISRLNEGKYDVKHLDYFKKSIKTECFCNELDENDLSSHGYLNLNNGVLETSTGILHKHSNQFKFKSIIPINYNPDAKCPLFIQFLDEVMLGDPELIQLIQEMIGYILLGGKPFLHKAFVLLGNGRNGKSTLIDVIRAMLGDNNISNVPLNLLNKPFSTVQLNGKMANLVEETPSGEQNSEEFKAAVGGGIIMASNKGKDEFPLRVNARFVFACNEAPTFKDKKSSILDRLVIIPFNYYVPEDKRDFQLTEKLYAELEGILTWCIEGAIRVNKNRQMIKPKRTSDMLETFRNENDKIYSWFNESIQISTNSEDYVTSNQLYVYYRNDSENNGNKPYAKNNFLKGLYNILRDEYKKIGIFEDPVKVRKINGKSVRVVQYIKYENENDGDQLMPWHI